MDTNVILDQAATRADALRAQRQKTHATAVEDVLDEIRRPDYERAKARLPKIEQAIRQRMRPQLVRLATVAATAGLALPQQARQWQAELTKVCDEVPHQLRTGLTGFEQLSFRDIAWQDGRAGVDPTRRASIVDGTRMLLNGSDGILSYMEQRWLNIEEFLAEWPPTQPDALDD